MSKEAFDPRQAPEYLALIESSEFTAAELEPLLAVLPQGATVANYVDHYGFQSFVVQLPCGQRVGFEAKDIADGLCWRFYMVDGATKWSTAADAWAEWVATARKQHAALGAVLAAVDGAS